MGNYGNLTQGKIWAYRRYLYALNELERAYEDCIDVMPRAEYLSMGDSFKERKMGIHRHSESVRGDLRKMEKEFFKI